MRKLILVTGASDGIGKEIVLRLARESVDLLLVARDSDKLDSVGEKVLSIGKASVKSYSCDLRNSDEISDVVNMITTEHKCLDGLINVAGIWQKLNQLEKISNEEILNVLQTNLTGLILFTKALLPLLRKSDNSSIINVVSRSGYIAQEGQSVYTASKYGLKGFTEVLRQDLKDSNIRAAGVYQGGTNTNMFRKAGENIPEEKYSSFIPPEGIADVIAYMLNLPKNVWLPEVKIESK